MVFFKYILQEFFLANKCEKFQAVEKPKENMRTIRVSLKGLDFFLYYSNYHKSKTEQKNS